MNEMGEFVDPYEPRPCLKLGRNTGGKPKAAARPRERKVFGAPVRCPECGREFKPRTSRHKFCSRKCGERHRRRKGWI